MQKNNAPRVIYHYDMIDDYSLYFEEEGPRRIFTDDFTQIRFNTEGLRDSNFVLHATVGVWNDKNKTFDDEFADGDGWDLNLDDSGGSVTIDGTMLKSKSLDRVDIRLSAGVEVVTGTGDAVIPLCDEFAFAQISLEARDPSVEYFWNFGDRDLLPGWTQFVDRRQNCRVENSEYPDGKEYEITVTDVSLRDVEGSDVMVIDENEDGWNLRAENPGVSEVTVAFTDWDRMESGTETFTCTVGSDVYDCWFDPETGSCNLLPGKSAVLTADANHASYDPVGHEDHWESYDDMDSPSFVWAIDENTVPEEWRGFIKLTPDDEEEKKAVLSVSGVPEGWTKDDLCEIRVELTLFDGTDDQGQPVEKAKTDRWFRIAGTYAEVWLIDKNGNASRYIDKNLPVGIPVTVTPELRYYDKDDPDGYTTAPMIHARWYYDENCLTVKDQNGEKVGNDNDWGDYQDSEASTASAPIFTITRKGVKRTNLTLHVDVPKDDHMERIAGNDFQFDELHCDRYTAIWLDGNGSVLDSREYLFGGEAPATEKIPAKQGDEDCTYTFSGWDEGEWRADENTITCTFAPIFTAVPIVKHTLTISYVYADGSKASETHTEMLKEGAAYSVTSPTISGFTPDQAAVVGTMGTADVNVTVIYKAANVVDPDKAAEIVPSAAKITTTYNVSKTIAVVIKDQAGRVMSGRKVTCVINGKSQSKTTDAKGSVTFSTGTSLAPKTYTAAITCDGLYATVKLVVSKAAVKLSAKKKTFKVKTKTKKYTVTLKDNKGKALKKVKLTLKVKGKTYKAATNTKGKATFKITKLKKKGKYTAAIKYAGNKNYKAVSKKVKITVK